MRRARGSSSCYTTVSSLVEWDCRAIRADRQSISHSSPSYQRCYHLGGHVTSDLVSHQYYCRYAPWIHSILVVIWDRHEFRPGHEARWIDFGGWHRRRKFLLACKCTAQINVYPCIVYSAYILGELSEVVLEETGEVATTILIPCGIARHVAVF